MALTKDQLIADIAEAIDAPKTTARNALEQLGQIVADQLENGAEITLPGWRCHRNRCQESGQVRSS
jgi:DNA-binding protein HU-beta